jgi:hypothetical protein
MARHLVYFAHAEQAVLPRYQEALARRVGEVDLVPVRVEGLSGAYAKLADGVRGEDGRVLPGLMARYPAPRALEEYATKGLATYSAGYGLARAVFAVEEDRAEIDVYVAIDSIHADSDLETARGQLAGFVAFAQAAKAGEKVFWLGYTGVRTSGYASTTQVASWMNELTGGQGGGFRLSALHHHYPTDAEEHRAALIESGPGLLAGALEAWLKGR